MSAVTINLVAHTCTIEFIDDILVPLFCDNFVGSYFALSTPQLSVCIEYVAVFHSTLLSVGHTEELQFFT